VKTDHPNIKRIKHKALATRDVEAARRKPL